MSKTELYTVINYIYTQLKCRRIKATNSWNSLTVQLNYGIPTRIHNSCYSSASATYTSSIHLLHLPRTTPAALTWIFGLVLTRRVTQWHSPLLCCCFRKCENCRGDGDNEQQFAIDPWWPQYPTISHRIFFWKTETSCRIYSLSLLSNTWLQLNALISFFILFPLICMVINFYSLLLYL
jgi:hypothetical protein